MRTQERSWGLTWLSTTLPRSTEVINMSLGKKILSCKHELESYQLNAKPSCYQIKVIFPA